jgi:branched-chain amino acid transport system ATP-binding protein
MTLLETIEITKYFGGLAAVSDLSLNVKAGEILGLIGPNGAGKTTVFNLIAGVYSPTHGRIIFKGKDIAGNKPSIITQKGIARTFQLSRLFDNKTVIENMLIAFHIESKASFWRAILNDSSTQTREKNILEKAKELLDFVGLSDDMEGKLTKNLPHGHRKTLGLAMALATSPELLLLDEPVGGGGMNPEETRIIMDLIKNLKGRGITILIVEHNLRVVMGLCDRIVVLNFGKKLAEGSPNEIKENKEVIEAYLGVRTDVY